MKIAIRCSGERNFSLMWFGLRKFHLIALNDFTISFSEFDLEKEKSLLDEQGLRIAENQENSQKNRRKLAESTRGKTFIYAWVDSFHAIMLDEYGGRCDVNLLHGFILVADFKSIAWEQTQYV